jgi:NAD(P)-dependent dehydrogenase (short-subunit alcohol dehydrogenase family)
MSELDTPIEMLDLTDRVIVVTGAAGGLGAGIAKRLDQAGATVVAHSRSTPVSGGFDTVMAGLIMHARAAALAFGDRGVRVSSVSPGLIDRPGLAADWPEGVQRWVGAAPLRRPGTRRRRRRLRVPVLGSVAVDHRRGHRGRWRRAHEPNLVNPDSGRRRSPVPSPQCVL